MSSNLNKTHRSCSIKFSDMDVIFNYALNYIATIKGNENNLEFAKKFVADKRTKSYEKIFHPVFLKVLIRKGCKNAEIVLRRTNSKKDEILNITNVKEDLKNPQYFYLEAIKDTDINRSRTHIFNAITKSIKEKILIDIPLFGTAEDMLNQGYVIPVEMFDVVCSIQTFCLPHLGQHVSCIRDKMALPLKTIFSKKSRTSNSMKLKPSVKEKKIKEIKSHIIDFSRSNSIDATEKKKHKPSLGSLDAKCRSIENLLLSTSEFNDIAYLSNRSFAYHGNKDLPKSMSSLNEFNTYSEYELENFSYYKFECVLHDKFGLKHFKNFLNEEFSSENINFWEAVNNFSQITDEELMIKEASNIFYNYMDAQMNTPVNLESDMIDKARRQLNDPTPDMFNMAKDHIFHLMKTDSFSRFISSNHFNLWQNQDRNRSGVKQSSSNNSLARKRKSFFPQFLITYRDMKSTKYDMHDWEYYARHVFLSTDKARLSREESRKSSVQTIDSDCSSSGVNSNYCKIKLAYDILSIHNEQVTRSNKKFGQILKKFDKKINEKDLIAFDETDHRIVHFTEPFSNVGGRKIIVEKAALLRVGYAYYTFDTQLYENSWFILKCRDSVCLSTAIDPILKHLGEDFNKYYVIEEDQPEVKLEENTPVSKLHHHALLLLDKSIFDKVKIRIKKMDDLKLWKQIIKDQNFQTSLPFDKDNIVHSTSEFFAKYKLESRSVGFFISNIHNINFGRGASSQFDKQRGIVSEDQFEMPEFLKLPKCENSE